MHFKFIATATALLPIATTLCAAGPLPPPHLTPMELEAYHKGEPDGWERISCHDGAPPISEERLKKFEGARKALEEQLNGHGDVKTNRESSHPERTGADTPKPVDTKPGVQQSNPPETREKSTRMRRTAIPLPLPQQLTQERIEHYAKMDPPGLPDENVPQCKKPGISKEDREKVMRVHKQWKEEKVHGHGDFMPIGEALRILPPV
jgi:hypothetical protein